MEAALLGEFDVVEDDEGTFNVQNCSVIDSGRDLVFIFLLFRLFVENDGV